MTAASEQGKAGGAGAVEAYLKKVPEPYRAALRDLRAIIASTAPQAEEAMVYGVPGFRQGGKPLVCYAAFKAHCGFYPMDPALMDALAGELESFRTAKGTLQFTPERPLPAALIRRIVKARADQNAAAS